MYLLASVHGKRKKFSKVNEVKKLYSDMSEEKKQQEKLNIHTLECWIGVSGNFPFGETYAKIVLFL